MYNICICEDNDIQAEIIMDMLNQLTTDDYKIHYKHFSNGNDLIKYLVNNSSFDIYLLDLLLPDISGMEIARKLRRKNDKGIFIFITSSSEYAVESYDVNAFYYMLKPIDEAKFNHIIYKAILSIKEKENILNIKTTDGIKSINCSEICYIDCINRCIVFHMNDMSEIRTITIRKSIADSLKELKIENYFFKCGPGLYINTNLIDVYGHNSIIFKNGMLAYPSKSGMKNLKKNIINNNNEH